MVWAAENKPAASYYRQAASYYRNITSRTGRQMLPPSRGVSKKNVVLAIVDTPLIPTGRDRSISDFKPNLVYIATSRPYRSTQQHPSLKQTKRIQCSVKDKRQIR